MSRVECAEARRPATLVCRGREAHAAGPDRGGYEFRIARPLKPDSNSLGADRRGPGRCVARARVDTELPEPGRRQAGPAAPPPASQSRLKSVTRSPANHNTTLYGPSRTSGPSPRRCGDEERSLPCLFFTPPERARLWRIGLSHGFLALRARRCPGANDAFRVCERGLVGNGPSAEPPGGTGPSAEPTQGAPVPTGAMGLKTDVRSAGNLRYPAQRLSPPPARKPRRSTTSGPRDPAERPVRRCPPQTLRADRCPFPSH